MAAPSSDPSTIIATTAGARRGLPGNRPEDPHADREHHRRGDAGPHGGEDHLLHRHRPDRERGQEPVLDLVAVGELDDQRQGGALQPGEDGGQGHQPGEEHLRRSRVGRSPSSVRTLPKTKRRKRGWRITWARKIGNSRPVTKRSRRRMASPVCHGPHGRERRAGSAIGPVRWRSRHRRDLPVRWMKTSSRVGSPSRTSVEPGAGRARWPGPPAPPATPARPAT